MRYCQLNHFKACHYTYPDYLDSTKYSATSCPADGTGGPGTNTTGNLSAVVSNSDIVLTWADFYQGEDEYQIERRNSGSYGTGTWTKIGTAPLLAGTSGVYRDPAVPSGSYDYRVKPCMRTGSCVGESNIAPIWMLGEGGGGGTSTCSSYGSQSSCVAANL